MPPQPRRTFQSPRGTGVVYTCFTSDFLEEADGVARRMGDEIRGAAVPLVQLIFFAKWPHRRLVPCAPDWATVMKTSPLAGSRIRRCWPAAGCPLFLKPRSRHRRHLRRYRDADTLGLPFYLSPAMKGQQRVEAVSGKEMGSKAQPCICCMGAQGCCRKPERRRRHFALVPQTGATGQGWTPLPHPLLHTLDAQARKAEHRLIQNAEASAHRISKRSSDSSVGAFDRQSRAAIQCCTNRSPRRPPETQKARPPASSAGTLQK